jgi:DNA-directed RNA polymerase specialized sigma24 family protein
VSMTAAHGAEQSFTDFARVAEPRLRRALTALFGLEAGKDAAADALLEGWRQWERVKTMQNPVGYLYVIGRNAGRGADLTGLCFPASFDDAASFVEPALPRALEALPDRQRQVVMLVHGYGWTHAEVAEVLGISRTTVQKHVERSVSKLRHALGVSK